MDTSKEERLVSVDITNPGNKALIQERTLDRLRFVSEQLEQGKSAQLRQRFYP